MAVVVSLINMKGGVGKTTLAFNLAWYAAYKKNCKVLLIDLDPQANASQYLLGVSGYMSFLSSGSPTVSNILEQFTPPSYGSPTPKKITSQDVLLHVRKWSDGSFIDLIPSRLELAWTLKNPTGKDHILANFIAKIEDKYDLVLIDCAPTESILTTAAYRASGYVLVPVKPEFLAAIGLPLLARSLNEFALSYETHHLQIAGIVFNDADPQFVKPEHKKARHDVSTLANSHGWYVFENEVRHSDSYPTGARNGSPIFQTDYARWWVKNEFDAFGDEFMNRVGL